MTQRTPNGRFALGNRGGPGRPRRVIEADYLAALGEAITLDEWQQIVLKAKDDAKAGDAKAREWLGRHLLGAAGQATLRALAVAERNGESVDDELAREAAFNASQNRFNDVMNT